MARYFSMQGMGVSLLMVATFLAICEAGYYQQRAMQRKYFCVMAVIKYQHIYINNYTFLLLQNIVDIIIIIIRLLKVSS